MNHDRLADNYLINAPEKDIDTMIEGWMGTPPNAAEWETYFRLQGENNG